MDTGSRPVRITAGCAPVPREGLLLTGPVWGGSPDESFRLPDRRGRGRTDVAPRGSALQS